MNYWSNTNGISNGHGNGTTGSTTTPEGPATCPVEVILVLDQSGSMGGVRNATIESVNAFLDKQVEQSKGQRYLSVYLFNSDFEPRFEARKIADAPRLDRTTYRPDGCTALYDAIGEAIERTELRVSCCRDNPSVVLAVMTDGLENASRRFNAQRVRRMLDRVKSNGWETFFLGASDRSLQEAEEIGFEEDRGIRFALAPTEIRESLDTMSEKVMCVAMGSSGRELDFSKAERQKLAGKDDQ